MGARRRVSECLFPGAAFFEETTIIEPDLDRLIAGVLAGETVPIARALSLMEDRRGASKAIQQRLLTAFTAAERAPQRTVGLTGPPGVGKSTLADALARRWLANGLGVGVAAVDPTSRRTGGALLGDRARIQADPDERIFIRSLASGDRLGGLAPSTRGAVAVLRAAFERVLVETVGVGQSEVAVETVADTVVLVLQPGSGDALQFMKAGILEIPDIFVVHKSDLGKVAVRTQTALTSTLSLDLSAPGPWSPPILLVSAQTGEGVDALVEAMDRHAQHLLDSGEGEARRVASRTAWAREQLVHRYGTWGLERAGGDAAVQALIAETAGTALDAFAALAGRLSDP